MTELETKKLNIGHIRTCRCPSNHINCLTAKEWVKSQVIIQEFFYEKRDTRDKEIHPAVFPIALPSHFIRLFEEYVMESPRPIPYLTSGASVAPQALCGSLSAIPPSPGSILGKQTGKQHGARQSIAI